MKLGQPTRYKEEYCEMLKKHMGDGFSFMSFGAIVDVCRSTLYLWVDSQPDFKAAKEMAFTKNLLFWEKQGIDGLYSTVEKFEGGSISKALNTGVWCFNMKNRHGWTDKTEVTGDKDKPITLNFNPKDIKKQD